MIRGEDVGHDSAGVPPQRRVLTREPRFRHLDEDTGDRVVHIAGSAREAAAARASPPVDSSAAPRSGAKRRRASRYSNNAPAWSPASFSARARLISTLTTI